MSSLQPTSSASGSHQSLDGLYQISQILAAGTAQREMLAEVLEVMDREMALLRGTVMLLSADGSEITTEIAHNVSPRGAQETRYLHGEGIVGRVVKTGTKAIIPKISEEPDFLDRLHKRRVTADNEISFICVPILLGNESIGALACDVEFDAAQDLQDIAQGVSIIASMIARTVHFRRQSAFERQHLEEENLRLREQLEDRFRPENLIGNSGAMREVYRLIHQVSPSDASVLIGGESGTGKELVANAIHYSSPRAKGPFVKVNCAALSENLIESELFGHEKGAFTGALQARKGRIEEAEGGTLFLDEIGDFSHSTQVKLLRNLQEREYQRVGSNENRKANVRIVCATHRDLDAMVEAGEFRQDLFYRINVFPIHMPPLRDRRDDVTLLADFFTERYAKRMGKPILRISTPAINMMMVYHWPGNVRELENCIERAVLLSSDGVIRGHHLPPSLQTSDATDTSGQGALADRVALFERDIIVDALKRTGGNVSAAARELETTQRILGYRIKQLQIDYRKYRTKA
ncbi:MAG: sigma 54-interacting transcriptional regulator [Phycisphaerales bacterium]|nr:sigma 54-interacting transcriptional regulator [Phycisphaerales bacterium]